MEGSAGSPAAGLLPPRVQSGQDPRQRHGSAASTSFAVVALTLREGGISTASLSPASINGAAFPSLLLLQQRPGTKQLSASLWTCKASLPISLWFPAATCQAPGKASIAVVSPSVCWCADGSGHPSPVPTAGHVLAKFFKPWLAVYTGSNSKSFWLNKANKYCKTKYKVY